MTQLPNEALTRMYREIQERKEALGEDADSDIIDATIKKLKAEPDEQQSKEAVEKFKKLFQS